MLLQKALKNSDVGSLGRIILPKVISPCCAYSFAFLVGQLLLILVLRSFTPMQ